MDKIRLNLADLKRAISWIESNTSEVNVILETDTNKIYLHVTDKFSKSVEITLYSTEVAMMPKIKKTENL